MPAGAASSGGVLEATMAAMGVPPHKLLAWLGPAIGPQVYEVGEDVRAAFSRLSPALCVPTRPGHWLLDLYAVAREKLKGLKSVSGGGFCTYTERRALLLLSPRPHQRAHGGADLAHVESPPP